jgi:ParB-like chromosome segregation protein Spo0J
MIRIRAMRKKRPDNSNLCRIILAALPDGERKRKERISGSLGHRLWFGARENQTPKELVQPIERQEEHWQDPQTRPQKQTRES